MNFLTVSAILIWCLLGTIHSFKNIFPGSDGVQLQDEDTNHLTLIKTYEYFVDNTNKDKLGYILPSDPEAFDRGISGLYVSDSFIYFMDRAYSNVKKISKENGRILTASVPLKGYQEFDHELSILTPIGEYLLLGGCCGPLTLLDKDLNIVDQKDVKKWFRSLELHFKDSAALYIGDTLYTVTASREKIKLRAAPEIMPAHERYEYFVNGGTSTITSKVENSRIFIQLMRWDKSIESFSFYIPVSNEVIDLTINSMEGRCFSSDESGKVYFILFDSKHKKYVLYVFGKA